MLHYSLTANNKNATITHVIFFNNNIAYAFTLIGEKSISDENMKAFENMLNTVNFEIN